MHEMVIMTLLQESDWDIILGTATLKPMVLDSTILPLCPQTYMLT